MTIQIDISEEAVARLREQAERNGLDAAALAKLILEEALRATSHEEADYTETVRVLRERLEALDAGEPGVPVDEAFARIRARLGFDESP